MTYDELIESILTAQEQMLQHSIEANSVTLNGRKYGKLIENLPPNMKPTVFGMTVKIESGKFNAAIQRGRTIDEILERERKHGNLSA